MTQRAWNVLSLIEETARYFDGKQIENPRLQAELLLADVLKVRRLDLYLQFERELQQAELEGFREHVRRRAKRVPVQYITGESGFRNLNLSVSNAVLIPRPETEVLVETALEYLAEVSAPAVLDVGCGSGAISLSIAGERDDARIFATDISSGALQVARKNAAQSKLESRVAFLCADLLDSLKPSPHFAAILSNPPYLKSASIGGLEPEVRDHEPLVALDGGADGLSVFKRLFNVAKDFLLPAGHLILEVADALQAEGVAELMSASGMEIAEIRPDLNEIPRVVVARKLGASGPSMLT